MEKRKKWQRRNGFRKKLNILNAKNKRDFKQKYVNEFACMPEKF